MVVTCLACWLAIAVVVDAGPVIVRTSPPSAGARVFVDGVEKAVTATDGGAILTGLQAGRRTVRLQLPGGAEIVKPVMVTAGDLASQAVFEIPPELLEPESGAKVTVLVSGNVGGATVEVDGQPVGRTGGADGSLLVSVAPGRHSVRLLADGYQTQEKLVDFKPGPVGKVSFELKRGAAEAAGRGSSSGVLTVALVGILGIAVVALAFVAVHAVRRSSGQAITTKRLDRYEMREIIGRGGMATVYRATDVTAPSSVAIALKVLDEAHFQDYDLVHKFLREGEVLQNLNRADPEAPLVEVYHYGRAGGDSGRPFIAMELLDGVDLLQYLSQRRRLPVRDAIRVALGVARALIPAHSAGVYHRDLTPDNVILVQQPKGGHHLRLIDFGVARHEYTSHGTLDGSITGKPPYMSPEQCQGEKVDGRSDIYALGVMLFSLLNGSPPFTHTNPLEVMRMHNEDEVVYPDSIPQPIVRFLRKALAKNREARFPEIVTVHQELIELGRSDWPS
jgi:hypothetical protein